MLVASLGQTAQAILVLVEHEGPSYLLSIDKKTGKNNWLVEREPRVSWTSPLVCEEKIIVSSNGIVEVFEAASGKRLWFVDGIKKNTVPSPSCNDDVVIVGSSAKKWCMAIKRNGNGNAQKNILWKASTSSSFSSPLIYGDSVYFINRAGIVTCVDIKDGSKKWSERLPASVWASPVVAEERLYFFCKDGTTVVAATGTKFKQLAKNSVKIEQAIVYGVAVVDSNIVIRTGQEILCIRNTG